MSYHVYDSLMSFLSTSSSKLLPFDIQYFYNTRLLSSEGSDESFSNKNVPFAGTKDNN